MPKYLRTFFCKKCGKQATLDELTEGVTVVECKPCDVGEYWGSGSLVDQPMDHFHFQDVKMEDC